MPDETKVTAARRVIPKDTREFTLAESCGDHQCREVGHRCPGCGNDLHGDNLCMVSACQEET